MRKLLFLSFIFISATSFAQFSVAGSGSGISDNATAVVTARIVSPIAVRSLMGLDFGDIVVGNSSGRIAVSTEGVRTGPEDMLINNGRVTQARFSVNAAQGYAYSIAMSNTDLQLEGDGKGGNSFMKAEYTHDKNADTGGSFLGTGDEQIINVGGELHVKPSQLPGIYTGTVTMTVAYE